MRRDEYAKLVSAVRQTAGALRTEAEHLEPKDKEAARHLRKRATNFDTRATEMELKPPRLL
ncbi:MAG: hypothetical protein V3T80_04015 [Kiloniellales bacterium]|jgi:hypothetical protein